MTSLTHFKESCVGPLFKNEKEKIMGISEMDVLFHWMLYKVRKCDPSIIPEDVYIEEVYSVWRSLRRGATSEARNAKLPSDVIDANNR